MISHPLKKAAYCLVCMLMLPLVVSAQEPVIETASYFSNALFNTLLVTIVLLLILVVSLGSVLKNLAGSNLLPGTPKTNPSAPGLGKGTLLFMLLSLGYFSYGQDAQIVVLAKPEGRIGGLDPFTFYFMIIVIAAELLVTGILITTIKSLLASVAPEKVKAKSVEKVKVKPILDKLNAAVDIADEESILLDHDYDGIKELDNDLPPWWKYGFYLTILVSVVYLINYHITRTAPLQVDEYNISLKKAELEIAEVMKNSANNVDESSVKLLTTETDLSTGKDLFIANCAACHGKLGEGTVGPNLTDDYWLHAGSVKDIFKTIKYGWPDKGMKAWKEDFSPIQIAQLTSFIKTLRGSNPPKAKEQQGDLYTEVLITDSLSGKPDSLTTISLQDTIR